MRIRDENKIEAIRKKAISMIVKNGFDGLSMQKLAKAANVSPATIYIYYKDRQDLLNQLYIECEQKFTLLSLKNFDPEMNFEDGLWQLWKNRFSLIIKDPLEFYFMEQFRNSPLINHRDVQVTTFKEKMGKFVHNSIKKNQLVELPIETYWSIAYGPFYSLIKFHLHQKTLHGKKFILTEKKMRIAFELVLKALKPSTKTKKNEK
jgi:TetR/AcrR family transcriptional regulator, multidrug resistance operon repressor